MWKLIQVVSYSLGQAGGCLTFRQKIMRLPSSPQFPVWVYNPTTGTQTMYTVQIPRWAKKTNKCMWTTTSVEECCICPYISHTQTVISAWWQCNIDPSRLQRPLIWRPTNPGLSLSPGLFFFCLNAPSEINISIRFKASHHQIFKLSDLWN